MNKPALTGLTLAAAMAIFTVNVMAGAAKTKPKPYPLKTCLVTGDRLGEIGDPVVFVHEGQEIKICCKMCRKKFDKNPAKYLKKLTPVK